MANLITTSFFVGDINIPNTGKPEIAESLNLFIGKYENQLLKNLFGYELWKSYKADATTQRFVDLINGVEYDDIPINKWRGLVYTIDNVQYSLIANYIFYNWLKDKSSWNSGIGVIRPTPNQAVNMSPSIRMVSVWNEFSEQVFEFADYMSFSSDVYPEWDSCNIWNFRRTNDFDI